MIFIESAHRVAMSVRMVSPSHAIFLRGGTGACVPRPRTGVRIHRPSATRPSYYTRGALQTRGGCRASIAHASIRHASILLHAWSPKNKGWVQSVHRPRVHRPRVHLITRVEP